MADITATVQQINLPLKAPFGTGRWSIDSREVLILQLFDRSSGFTGYGEAAPLEPFGTESLKQAVYAMEQALEERPFDRMIDTPLDNLMLATCSFSATPTVRYALESAILDLRAKREGIPLNQYLGGDELDSIKVNAAIGNGDVESTASAVKRYTEEGYGCIKLKVGARELDEDVDRIERAREICGPDILLRLDANGSWSRKETERAIHRLETFDIEYIEQPVVAEDRDGLTGIAADSPIPIAADEILQNTSEIENLLESRIPVFIFKPMVLGSLTEVRRLAQKAVAAGKKVVFTSFIDSAVGRSSSAHLALSLSFSQDLYHGFATGQMFREDTAKFSDISNSLLRLPGGSGTGISLNLHQKGQ